jgi:SAM-dependent methyltransferase
MSASSAAFFDAIARRYDRVYATSGQESRLRLSRLLRELSPASRVLDLGVGTGRELPALLDAGHSPVGLDASQQMLDLCAKRARPIPLVLGDLWARLPWDDSSFDAVIALHGTLSHPPSSEVRAGLPKEIARVLRPGGVFFAELPTDEWLERMTSDAGGSVTRSGAGRGVFVDDVTGASVEVSLLPANEWTKLFEPCFAVRTEVSSEGEMTIVALRTDL